MNTPGASPADAAARWEAECHAREKAALTLLLPLAHVVILSWVLFDALLEPAMAPLFALWRVSSAVVALALWRPLRRASTATRVRLLGLVTVSAACVAVALMVPRAEHHALYMLGYSLIPWTVGVVLQNPPGWTAGVASVVMVAYAAAHLGGPGRHAADEVLGGGIYLATVCVFIVLLSVLRTRLQRRAFELSGQLQQSNRELARALEELRDAQARMVATEKMSALGRLLAGLSHEINNPINVIHNNIGPLRTYTQDMTQALRALRASLTDTAQAPEAEALWSRLDLEYTLADVEPALAAMEAASLRIQHIHGELRAYSRGDVQTPQTLSLVPGLEATVAMLRRNAPPGVVLTLETGPLPDVPHRPTAINQILFNLIQNALDAVGSHGSIAVRAQLAGPCVEVRVKDSGPGVDAAVAPRLFEPFFTTKDVGRGTGLGLAISRQLAEQHGGTLTLEPQATPGALFVLRLPVAGAS